LLCLERDPRVDAQVEDRSPYFGALAVRLGLDAAAILELAARAPVPDLLCEVLAECALRGDAAALRIVRHANGHPDVALQMVAHLRDRPEWSAQHLTLAVVAPFAQRLHDDDELVADVEIYGAFWAPWRGKLPLVEAAFVDAAAAAASEAAMLQAPTVDPGALGTDALLRIADHPGAAAIARELDQRTTPADRALLAAFVAEGASMRVARIAAGVLGRLGDPRLMNLADAMFEAPDDLADPARRLAPLERMRRAVLLHYVQSLPAACSLEPARQWWPRGGFSRTAAGKVLARHAEPADREWLEDHLQRAIPRSTGLEITDELEAVARLRDARSIDVLAAAAERATYGWARVVALRGLEAHADRPAVAALLEEALWDAELDGREAGCRSAPLSAAVRSRLGELAADPWEDPAVAQSAADRLGG